ncbi:30S ribosomal protein S17 [Stratiformator vulcanicus]|uniref:Small ribosomal subunit protein uS17 n=1 Tax=Stratiformator vulcanicus TaxID=2527980 RepID=A0A517R0T5_9PLAN|nr:30S ribosomal protein S17 [Stratiformator vulcanicus]
MRRTLRGIVKSDKNLKTRRVEVERRFRHPKYGKIVKGRTVCHVHDENNDSQMGDLVEIIESRPLSKLKRWELVKVVREGERTERVDVSTAVIEETKENKTTPEVSGDEVTEEQPAAEAPQADESE